MRTPPEAGSRLALRHSGGGCISLPDNEPSHPIGKLPRQFNFCHHIAAGASGAVSTSEILNWRAQKFVPQ